MSDALMSPCGLYRYTLTRDTGDGSGIVNFIMLNPSTADASADDPTIRRCVAFARSWGYRTLVVTNLFAFRATDPAVLERAIDPVGPDNDKHIAEQAAAANLVVCAWGGRGGVLGRANKVVASLLGRSCRLSCIRQTASGSPGHPLYLPSRLSPQRWP